MNVKKVLGIKIGKGDIPREQGKSIIKNGTKVLYL